jgi:hypothetical protein
VKLFLWESIKELFAANNESMTALFDSSWGQRARINGISFWKGVAQ